MERHHDPSDGRDDEWSVGAPSLTLMTDDVPGRESGPREGCNGRLSTHTPLAERTRL
jgi:hypothetical protein